MAYGGSLGTQLFQNTIAASPFLPEQYSYADFVPTQSYYAFAYKVGCFDGTPFLNQSQTIIQCLREKDSLILQQAAAIVSATGRYAQWGFLPVTDGDFVQDLPSKQLQAKKVNGLRMLSGVSSLSSVANKTTTSQALPPTPKLALDQHRPTNDPLEQRQ